MSTKIVEHEPPIVPRVEGHAVGEAAPPDATNHETDRCSRRLNRPFIPLGFLLVAGLAALAVDLPLSRTLVTGQSLEVLHDLLRSVEPFGQPTAILVTAAAIALCDPTRRVAVPRLLAAALGAGLAADIVKLLVARSRPYSFDLTESVWSSFREAFPGFDNQAQWQSFPSAHTATAVGFALALSHLFPAGRWLFVTLAGLVAMQRIEVGAHYLSDTCWGAAVGSAIWLMVSRKNLLGGWFDRKEHEWASEPP
ncbi:MAG: phosphatase PAP2 family protein [Planctomycetaceae bacterium]|nr:phosphatase PAP2 family protein [Planctomycetaceae bacterium]